jgi:hypothetical protein
MSDTDDGRLAGDDRVDDRDGLLVPGVWGLGDFFLMFFFFKIDFGPAKPGLITSLGSGFVLTSS